MTDTDDILNTAVIGNQEPPRDRLAISLTVLAPADTETDADDHHLNTIEIRQCKSLLVIGNQEPDNVTNICDDYFDNSSHYNGQVLTITSYNSC